MFFWFLKNTQGTVFQVCGLGRIFPKSHVKIKPEFRLGLAQPLFFPTFSPLSGYGFPAFSRAIRKSTGLGYFRSGAPGYIR